MNNEEIVSHLMDIKIAIATIQQQNLEMKEDLIMHDKSTRNTRQEVYAMKDELKEAKAVLRTLKWVIGFVVVTAPAAAAGLIKLYNSFN